MKHRILCLTLGTFVLLLTLFSANSMDARFITQITSTPTTFNRSFSITENCSLPPTFGWCDDFNDGIIDEAKWLPPSDENIIYELNGMLNLALEQPQSVSTWANIEGILAANRLVREIEFTITLESYEGNAPGGAGLDIFLNDGRVLSVDVGLGPGGPWVEILLCPYSGAPYKLCDNRDGPSVIPNDSIDMRVIWSGASVDFYIDNILYHSEPACEPITAMQFHFYADPGSVFHVTVDDVYVLYNGSDVFLPLLLTNSYSTWEIEPNNSFSSANGPLVSGTPYYGYPNDEIDVFFFDMETDSLIVVELTEYNVLGGQLQLWDNPSTAPVGFDIASPYLIAYDGVPGRYYVVIAAPSGSTSTTPYTLRVTYPSEQTQQSLSLPSPNQPLSPLSWAGYNFEAGIENWITSEGDYKLAVLDTTSEVVCIGNQALQLTTELYYDENDHVFQHTEAVAYFDTAIPQGIDHPGPYDLTGKQVSCFVYLPSELALDNPEADVSIFVKDTPLFRNQYGEPVYITTSNVEQWLYLSLIVENTLDFDATQTNALGVRIELQDGSSLEYTGPIYIDHCTIEYP